jgi:hypothetical protein
MVYSVEIRHRDDRSYIIFRKRDGTGKHEEKLDMQSCIESINGEQIITKAAVTREKNKIKTNDQAGLSYLPESERIQREIYMKTKEYEREIEQKARSRVVARKKKEHGKKKFQELYNKINAAITEAYESGARYVS